MHLNAYILFTVLYRHRVLYVYANVSTSKYTLTEMNIGKDRGI